MRFFGAQSNVCQGKEKEYIALYQWNGKSLLRSRQPIRDASSMMEGNTSGTVTLCNVSDPIVEVGSERNGSLCGHVAVSTNWVVRRKKHYTEWSVDCCSARLRSALTLLRRRQAGVRHSRLVLTSLFRIRALNPLLRSSTVWERQYSPRNCSAGVEVVIPLARLAGFSPSDVS